MEASDKGMSYVERASYDRIYWLGVEVLPRFSLDVNIKTYGGVTRGGF